jgi:hypothetical protein
MNEKKNYNWTLSKWFWYVVVLIILLFLIGLMTYFSTLDIDFALRFLPTLLGLLITFSIFIVFFDLREELEWKTVRDRVMRRIGRQLYGVFVNVSSVCEVDVAFDFETAEDYKKYQSKQLTELVTKKLKINNAYEKEDTSRVYGQLFENLENALEDSEARYEKFLSPYFQNSLLNLEENLNLLSFAYMGTIMKKEDRLNIITDNVSKIMKIINEMRKKGIDVGF